MPQTHANSLRKSTAHAAFLLLAAMLGGCGYISEMKLPFITPTGKKLDAPQAGPKPAAYPVDLPIAEPLDIEVIRVGNAIELDNRSTQTYAEAQIWLNHAYGAVLKNLPIGRSSQFNLESFINEYGELYPVGYFLKPERDRKLVMADLVIDGKIHKLTVRLADDWRRP